MSGLRLLRFLRRNNQTGQLTVQMYINDETAQPLDHPTVMELPYIADEESTILLLWVAQRMLRYLNGGGKASTLVDLASAMTKLGRESVVRTIDISEDGCESFCFFADGDDVSDAYRMVYQGDRDSIVVPQKTDAGSMSVDWLSGCEVIEEDDDGDGAGEA